MTASDTPLGVEPQPTASTPEPVVKAAWIWGTLSGFITTAIGVLVAVGALTSAQGDAYGAVVDYVSVNLVPVATAIVGVVGLVSSIASHQATAWVARRKVTPVAEAPVAKTYRSEGTVR